MKSLTSVVMPLKDKDRLKIERGKYHAWRNQTKEAKIYLSTLFAMCEGECPKCGRDMILTFSKQYSTFDNRATLDHIVPMSKVVEHNKFGLQILCARCNQDKGDNTE